MNLVSDLDLPVFDYTAPDFSADRYHQQLAETGQQGWLAKSPLAYIVLDHDSGEFFLRSRATLPITWSGSSAVIPNHGPEPSVT
jgi:hypothetical protein